MLFRSAACENGGVTVKSLRRALEGIVGGDFSDPTNERLIYMSAAGLALVGIGLLVATILWWRRGRQEHPALAPLEVMSGRAWAKAPEGDRRRRLDQVRPAGAGLAMNELMVYEPVDLEALVRSVPQAFDDLREPGEAISLPAAAEPEAVQPIVVEPVVVEPVMDEPVVAEPVVAEPVEEAATADSKSVSTEPAV